MLSACQCFTIVIFTVMKPCMEATVTIRNVISPEIQAITVKVNTFLWPFNVSTICSQLLVKFAFEDYNQFLMVFIAELLQVMTENPSTLNGKLNSSQQKY